VVFPIFAWSMLGASALTILLRPAVRAVGRPGTLATATASGG